MLRALFTLIAGAVLLSVGSSLAEQAPVPPASSQSADSTATMLPAKPSATIDGFRSAKFGMTEQQVRAAIQNDFGLKDAQIRQDNNPVQKISVLTVDLKDLLPGTGTARLSYVLGSENKKLFTVNIVWAHALNPADTREVLLDAAAVLRGHFESETFGKGVLADARLPDGSVLVFRGADTQGRMVVLTAAGLYTSNAGGDKEPPQPEPALRLSYIEDPQHPDVYSIKQGQF